MRERQQQKRERRKRRGIKEKERERGGKERKRDERNRMNKASRVAGSLAGWVAYCMASRQTDMLIVAKIKVGFL